jgi:3,4-dihydroxy 2-butanone 4-phosphate synthase/GTP cyclohydrolase II
LIRNVPCAGALCEIVNPEDGSMARGPQLLAFARHHSLRCVTIADLVRHRLRHESGAPETELQRPQNGCGGGGGNGAQIR